MPCDYGGLHRRHSAAILWDAWVPEFHYHTTHVYSGGSSSGEHSSNGWSDGERIGDRTAELPFRPAHGLAKVSHFPSSSGHH